MSRQGRSHFAQYLTDGVPNFVGIKIGPARLRVVGQSGGRCFDKFGSIRSKGNSFDVGCADIDTDECLRFHDFDIIS